MDTIIQVKIERPLSKEEVLKYQEVFVALVGSGAMSLKGGGKAILHFDHEGVFQGVQLDYWAFRRRKNP